LAVAGDDQDAVQVVGGLIAAEGLAVELLVRGLEALNVPSLRHRDAQVFQAQPSRSGTGPKWL
jgi:hypothetical protein